MLCEWEKNGVQEMRRMCASASKEKFCICVCEFSHFRVMIYQKKNLACWIFLLNYLHLRDSHGKINFTVEQFSANTRRWASHFLKFVLQWVKTTHFAYHLAKSKHSREPFSLSIAVFHYLLFSSSSPLSTLFLCARSLFEIE